MTTPIKVVLYNHIEGLWIDSGWYAIGSDLISLKQRVMEKSQKRDHTITLDDKGWQQLLETKSVVLDINGSIHPGRQLPIPGFATYTYYEKSLELDAVPLYLAVHDTEDQLSHVIDIDVDADKCRERLINSIRPFVDDDELNEIANELTTPCNPHDPSMYDPIDGYGTPCLIIINF